MKTLDTLNRKGVYVNDYPGLVMDGKDISYFFFAFTREEMVGGGPATPKKEREDFSKRAFEVIAANNKGLMIADTDKEFKIFYLDDQGNILLGRVEDDKEPVRIKTGRREIVADRVFQLNLNRVYSADGIDGEYQVKHSEAKNVHDALEKFIASYIYGWIGLFRQYETVREKTAIFRQFRPFKFPIFGTKETLKKPVFQIQLGVRSTNGDIDFKWVSTTYGDVTLENALAV
jgi:hypothetical protein